MARSEAIVIDGVVCRDWSLSSELEWLETNGTGGFAMGTVAGANTRRYHSLLTASLQPRTVLLSRVEEELLANGEQAILGAAQYPGTVTPQGFQHLKQFRLDPFPVWTYDACGVRVTKRFFLVFGRQTAVIQYTVDSPCRVRVRPFLAFRDYHSLQHQTEAWNRDLNQQRGCLSVKPFADLPELRLHHNSAGFVAVPHWYSNNEYRVEMERGLDFCEDLYSPGWFDFELQAGETAWLVATIEDLQPTPDIIAEWQEGRRPTGLEASADQFIVRRADGSPTIIAGYPWFTDWGRDTMISLPGLLIDRRRLTEAKQILESFLKHRSQGIIPNRFPDHGDTPEYNTADATLWAFIAAWELQQHGEEQFIRDVFYPAAIDILDWHEHGTHFGIRMDLEDGLLIAGDANTQLSWMDAKVGDWVVTPRHGKAVEINALWYNARTMMAWWANRFGFTKQAERYTEEAAAVRGAFEEVFWNPKRNCLFDRISPEGPDDRLRPNQIFALSLPFPLLPDDRARAVLRVVEQYLLTPYGLRTLEPAHPEYRAHYHGSPLERDAAYHQGTVWPWLIGPYIRARLNVYGHARDNLALCRQALQALLDSLHHGCLGSIGELYDAEPPHRPVGCPAQAWSVAELLAAHFRIRNRLL